MGTVGLTDSRHCHVGTHLHQGLVPRSIAVWPGAENDRADPRSLAGSKNRRMTHCVPVIMGTRAMDTGRRQIFDPEKCEIREG